MNAGAEAEYEASPVFTVLFVDANTRLSPDTLTDTIPRVSVAPALDTDTVGAATLPAGVYVPVDVVALPVKVGAETLPAGVYVAEAESLKASAPSPVRSPNSCQCSSAV